MQEVTFEKCRDYKY